MSKIKDEQEKLKDIKDNLIPKDQIWKIQDEYMMSNITYQRWTKSQKMTNIERLKDHHEIGRIREHIHAHEKISEYNTDA